MNLSKVIKAVDIGAAGVVEPDSPVIDPGFVSLDRGDGVDARAATIEAAHREAESIVAAAEKEAEIIRDEARIAGENNGLAAGRTAGHDEFSARIKAMADLLVEISSHRGELLRKQGRDLFELVRAMVERLCLGEISRSPAVIQRVVATALDHVVDRGEVTIKVSPRDFDLLQQGDDPRAVLGAGDRVRIVEDDGVSPGGCLVESGFGEVDATIETRRANLYQAVEEAFIEAVAREDEGDGIDD